MGAISADAWGRCMGPMMRHISNRYFDRVTRAGRLREDPRHTIATGNIMSRESHHGFSRRTVIKTLAAGGALAGLPVSRARAQDQFPAQPVTLIVPYGAGGTTDLYFRALAEIAAKHLGQSIIIDNKPGVGGAMGAIILAKATKSDGYTISQAPEGILRLPYLEQVSFDLTKDFTYVIGLAAYNFGVAVRKDSPFKTFQDVIKAARERPGELKYSAGLANTTMPLMMAKVEKDTGAKLLHVPYRNGTEMLTAVLGGHVDMIMDSNGGMATQIDSGEIRLLATYGETRSLRWPDVPTAREGGVDALGVMYFGLITAKGLDKATTTVLHDAFKKAMAEPQHEVLLKNIDMLPWYKSPDEFRDSFVQGYKNYADILEKAGLRKY